MGERLFDGGTAPDACSDLDAFSNGAKYSDGDEYLDADCDFNAASYEYLAARCDAAHTDANPYAVADAVTHRHVHAHRHASADEYACANCVPSTDRQDQSHRYPVQERVAQYGSPRLDLFAAWL